MEKWKDIPNYEGLYTVSNAGKVFGIKYNKEINPYLRKGYLHVHLSKKSKQKEFKVHRLVALLFLENPNNYGCVNHKDENKSNNIYTNLEWCTHQYNNTYGSRIKKQSESLKRYHKLKPKL